MKKIVINTLGGDLPLDEIIKGVNLALNRLEDEYSLVLVGPKDILSKKVNAEVEIVDASYDIESSTNPSDMMSKYTDCALMKAYKYMKANDDAVALIAMSGTGCVFVGAIFILGLIENIKAAVLAADLLNKNFKRQCLLDIGANIDTAPVQLLDFARIGSAFMKSYYKIENPRIGLVNLGAEPKKGNKHLKAAYELLDNSNLNFIGNIEFSNVFGEGHDVLVCDGLVGNAILKNTEGVYKIIEDIISTQKDNINDNIYKDIHDKIHFLFDYNNMGGSFLFGVNKIVIKAHGACNSLTIDGCVEQAIRLDKGDFISNLKKEFHNE